MRLDRLLARRSVSRLSMGISSGYRITILSLVERIRRHEAAHPRGRAWVPYLPIHATEPRPCSELIAHGMTMASNPSTRRASRKRNIASREPPLGTPPSVVARPGGYTGQTIMRPPDDPTREHCPSTWHHIPNPNSATRYEVFSCAARRDAWPTLGRPAYIARSPQNILSFNFAASVILLWSQGGSHTTSTCAARTPGTDSAPRCTDAGRLWASGQLGEVSVMRM